jgi:hypothetical protein
MGGPFRGQMFVGKDGIHWTFGFACAAFDAFVRIDEQFAVDPVDEMDAINRAHRDARLIDHVEAWLRDDVGQCLVLRTSAVG